MSSHSRQQLESWLKTIDIPHGATVLDVGGSQLPIKDRVGKWNATEYKILDLEQPHEVQQKPDIVFDIQEDDYGALMTHYNRFTHIFCIEVMEYVIDPLKALKNMHAMLKKGGTLYISFHFLYPVHNPIDYDALRYTPKGAVRLLEKAGFVLSLVAHEDRDLTSLGHEHWNALNRAEGNRAAREYAGHHVSGLLVQATRND